MQARMLLGAAVAALLIGPASAGAADPTPGGILAALNAERAANGLPAHVVEDADRSGGCFAHDEYGVLNGGWDAANPHGETPGRPGYSVDGAQAGSSSVLARGSSWADGDPWANAPWHYLQLMRPRLALSGADEHGGFDCLWTVDASGPAATGDSLFAALPGGHAAGAFWQAIQDEWPSAPGDLVGLPEGHGAPGTITGPNIAVAWDGPGAALPYLTAATLAGLGGAVVVSTIGNQLSGLAWPGSGIVLPRSPLAPDTDYTLTATFADDTTATPANAYTGTVALHTAPVVPVADLVQIGDLGTGSPTDLAIRVAAPATMFTGTVAVSSDYGLNAAFPPEVLGPGETLTLLPPGPGKSLTVSVTTRPFALGAVQYPAATVSRTYHGPPVDPPPDGGDSGGTASTPGGDTPATTTTAGGTTTTTTAGAATAAGGAATAPTAGQAPPAPPAPGSAGSIVVKAALHAATVRIALAGTPPRARFCVSLVDGKGAKRSGRACRRGDGGVTLKLSRAVRTLLTRHRKVVARVEMTVPHAAPVTLSIVLVRPR